METPANQNYIATAFLSCSLRTDDKEFVDLIERILEAHGILPIGTVGKFSAAPINTAELMKENIPLADFVVIVATPRYLQQDIKTGQTTYGLSEMVQVEAGMAYMANKPVVVFVQEGTHVGNFLPNITQYIELNGLQEDLNIKWALINSLLNKSYHIVQLLKDQAASKSFLSALKFGLAIYGGIKVVENLSKPQKPKRRITKRK